MNKWGSDIHLKAVTPAEVAILRKGHEGNVGGDPISDAVVYAQVNRLPRIELARLKRKYRNLRINDEEGKTKSVFALLFSGLNANLPEKFSDIQVPFTVGKPFAPVNSPDIALTEDEIALLDEAVETLEELEPIGA
jgi:hypothetical protein